MGLETFEEIKNTGDLKYLISRDLHTPVVRVQLTQEEEEKVPLTGVGEKKIICERDKLWMIQEKAQFTCAVFFGCGNIDVASRCSVA